MKSATTYQATLREGGAKRRGENAHRDSGAVLMEYVVLCCGVALVLLEFMHAQFFNFEQGYVGMGLDWAESVQRLHRAIALPIP